MVWRLGAQEEEMKDVIKIGTLLEWTAFFMI
jgi:hypothetical protein